ncbi:hypothetical protein CHI10_14725 [Bacillus sp. 7894-2]|nr:hypothetical protein CHI10_14725 [Bacillus sp. 7894-2]
MRAIGGDPTIRDVYIKKTGPAVEQRHPLVTFKAKLDDYFFGGPTDVVTAFQFYGFFIAMSIMAVVFAAVGMLN